MKVLGGFVLGACLAHAQVPPSLPIDPLATLRRGHPRLLLTAEREAELRSLTQTDDLLAELLQELHRAAERMLKEPVEEHRLAGPRLLAQSRAVLGKVGVLTLAARWNGDERFANRAWRELEAAAAFPDWNPDHFLDTAEMSAAFALAYDWLHDHWTPEQRALLRTTLVEKGLRPGQTTAGETATARENNWNPVSNGGLVLAALAVAEHEPELATATLRRAMDRLPNALQYYAPDGAWYEGPGYWKYGTTYLALLAAALETALGHDGGIGGAPGIDRTGHFFRDTIGPTGEMFNYADSDTRPGSSPALFWLARRFDAPELARFEHHLLRRHLHLLANRTPDRALSESTRREIKLGNIEAAELVYSNRFFPLEILWYQPVSSEEMSAPVSAAYEGVVDVALLRSSTPDAGEIFVGIKGAGVPNAHAHLDAGSFILEAKGRRWAEDLGMENYDLPGFWERGESGLRWRYFRPGSLSHNIVTIDGHNQRTPARAPLTAFSTAPERNHARFDLTDAYREQVASAHRGIALVGQTVLVQDELVGMNGGGTQARWAMLTGAEVMIDARYATLTLGGETLYAHLLAPDDAQWEVSGAEPTFPGESPNPGKSLLIARATLEPDVLTRFVVTFSPHPETPAGVPLLPLAGWDGGQ